MNEVDEAQAQAWVEVDRKLIPFASEADARRAVAFLEARGYSARLHNAATRRRRAYPVVRLADVVGEVM